MRAHVRVVRVQQVAAEERVLEVSRDSFHEKVGVRGREEGLRW